MEKMTLVWEFPSEGLKAKIHQLELAWAMRQKVEELLATTPDAPDRNVANWKLLKLNTRLFDDIWARVSQDSPTIDYNNCIIEHMTLQSGTRRIGYTNKKSQEWHGFQKQITKDGTIVLVTLNNGIKQGLEIAAFKDRLGVYINKDDKSVFSLIFEKSGKVVSRSDPEGKFADLRPVYFLKS